MNHKKIRQNREETPDIVTSGEAGVAPLPGVEIAKKYGFLLLGLILLLTIAVKLAQPVKDGDLFWQMEYGRYLWENRTLVPDHGMYSWTPTVENTMYCAWIGEIALYLMHQIGGLPLLFAFRYLCMLIVVGITWNFARRMGQGRDVFTFLVLAIVVLTCNSAVFLKPEIISMVFMAVIPWIYFSIKSSLWGRLGTRAFFLYPLLFLVWVNTHGVFINGIAILGCITVGEILNYMTNKQDALSRKGMGHLLGGSLLSLVSTLCTPYGFSYYVFLYDSYIAPEENLLISSVIGWQSIFQTQESRAHLFEFWLIMALCFIILYGVHFWKKRSLDWGIIIPTGFLAYMFTMHLRTIFYWPAFWGMSLIYLRGRAGAYWPTYQGLGAILKAGFVLIFLFLATRSMYETKYRPFSGRWLGFGIGYFNPVQESAFLKEHRPGKLLYNSYNVGGYLIYDLYPAYKVFCDPRGFPYAEWFNEYVEFNTGPTPIKGFREKYPFDVALVDYKSSESPILKFLKAREWVPVFYGTSSMVFVHKSTDFAHDFKESDKHRFDSLKSLGQAGLVLFVAQNLGDLDASAHILGIIRERFRRYPGYAGVMGKGNLMQDGLMAYKEGDYDRALANLEKVAGRVIPIRAGFVLLNLRNWKCKELASEGKYREALAQLEANLRTQPGYVDCLYNAGVLAYQIEVSRKRKTGEDGVSTEQGLSLSRDATNWKFYLRRFLHLAPDHRHAWVARQLLEGKGLPDTVPLVL